MALSAKDLLAKSSLRAGSLTEPTSWATPAQTEEERRAKQSAIARQTLVGAGAKDPTEDKPGAFRKLLGTMAAPGVGINALLYNATNLESTQDVNPLEEMAKSARGENVITGSDVVREWGVENQWGQALGGFVLDVLTDPLTYLTAGYSSATKAAAGARALDLATDMGRVARAADSLEAAEGIAQISAKYGDDIAAIVTKYASPADIPAKEAQKVASAFRKQIASDMGAKTGIRFAGAQVPGTAGVPEALTRTLRGIGENLPGADLFKKAFVTGNLDELFRGASQTKSVPLFTKPAKQGANELVRMAAKAGKRRFAAGSKAAGYQGRILADELAAIVPEQDIRDAITLGIGRQYGSVEVQREIFESYKDIARIEQQIADSGARVGGGLTRDLKTAQARYRNLISDVVLDREQIANTVAQATGDFSPATRDRVLLAADHLRDTFDGYTNRLLELGEITGDASGGILSGSYLPGMVGAEPVSAAQREMAERLGISVPENLRMPGTDPDDVTGLKSWMEKKYVNPEDRLTAGLETELDLAKLGSKKVQQDSMRVARAEFMEDMASIFGRTPKDPAIREAVNKLSEPFISDEALKGMLKTYDTILNEWKSMATAMNIPRFQNRNFLSNKYLMAMKGTLSVGSERESIALLKRIRKVLVNGDPFTDLSKADQTLFRELVENGVVTTKEDLAGLVGRGRDAVFRSGSGNRVAQAWDGWKRIGGDFNELVENQGRISVYLHQRAKGIDPSVAAQVVDDTLYSYDPTMLTAFENNVMKRVLPFYTWMRRNTPNMAQMLATNPKFMSIPSHLQRNTQDTVGFDPESAPSYLREAGLVFGMSEDESDLMAIRTDALFPLQDTETIFDALFGLSPLDTLTEVIENANPLLRVPLELVLNKNMYADAPIVGGPMGEKRRVSKGVQALDDLLRGVPGWTDAAIAAGGEYRQDSRGRTFLALPGQAEYILRNLLPPLESAGAFNPNNPDATEQVIGFLTGVRPVNVSMPDLREKKLQSDYFDLMGAVQGVRNTQKRRIDVDTLFGGGAR